MASDKDDPLNPKRRNVVLMALASAASVPTLYAVGEVQKADKEKSDIAARVIKKELAKKLGKVMSAADNGDQIFAILREAQDARCLDAVLDYLQTATEYASLSKGKRA